MSDQILFWSNCRTEHRAFSTFFPSVFFVDNIRYQSLEQFFHAQKCQRASEFRKIMAETDPKKIKHLGYTVEIVPDWDELKDHVMYLGTHAKFSQNPDLRTILLGTGDRDLIHFAPWGDTYWGVDKQMNGENKQGKITMLVREELSK